MTRAGLAVAALTIVLHAAVLLRGWPEPGRFVSLPDSREYLALAVNLRQGHGFSQAEAPPYAPDFLRTPVYPLVVAGLPAAAEAAAPLAPPLVRQAALLNTIVGLLTIAGVGWFMWRRHGGAAATVSVGLLATDLTSLTFHALALTETLFAALLVIAVTILASSQPLTWRRAAAAGAVLGLAVLCRPIAILLGPALLPVFMRQRASRSAPLVAAYLVCNLVAAVGVSAWVVRNVAVFGEARLTSVSSVNLYLHRAAYVEAARTGEPVEDARARLAEEFERQTRGLSEADRSRWLAREGEARLLEHPFTYAGQHLRGVIRMLGPERDDLARLLGVPAAGPMARLLVALGGLHLAIVYGGLAWACVRRRRDPLVVAAITACAYVAVIGGPEMYARFRMPLMPLFAAAVGVLASDDRFSRS